MPSSAELFAKACTLLPGGVNSPVRACKSVGTEPLFIEKGAGSRFVSVDGDEYVDYVLSWGPLLLGHAHPAVTQAATEAIAKGASFGAPCAAEIDLACAVVDAFPAIEMCRMVSSGTEATMSALRLARAYTGRDLVLKFEGCYHGHADAFLASAGSGVATFSLPGTPGVPEDTVRRTLLAPYNDLDACAAQFAVHGKQIAAIIVEPVAGNMGCVLPKPGFLEGLFELAEKHGALVIFDEVITGLRLSLGGAQARFGLTPHLTTLGKIIGGGLPVGCYGGKREIMERIAPCGDVYQAGTLSGNPVAMAAGIATMRELAAKDYAALETRTQQLANDLAETLRSKGLPVTVNGVASMFTLFFTDQPVTDYESAKKADAQAFGRLYRHMRAHGVNLAPSAFEAAFTSFAHTEQDYALTMEAAASFPG